MIQTILEKIKGKIIEIGYTKVLSLLLSSNLITFFLPQFLFNLSLLASISTLLIVEILYTQAGDNND